MGRIGKLYGIGVGPGAPQFLTLAAVNALNSSDLIYHPRARSAKSSGAKRSLSRLGIPESKFREVIFDMDTDRKDVSKTYSDIATAIAQELRSGKTIAYLTIGDALTYSTYNYALSVLLKILPELDHETIPGITSFAAVASAFDFSLGYGKERTLVLPCPDTLDALRTDITNHDVVILMKIGHRLPMVIELLKEMEIISHCVLGSRIGLENERLIKDLNTVDASVDGSADAVKLGYLSTLLIRKRASEWSEVMSVADQAPECVPL